MILIISDTEKWLIQCKRRIRENSTEGIETIRSLIGTMITQNSLSGIVVSTASQFSKFAKEIVCSPNLVKHGIEIKLMDFGILNQMIDDLRVKNPWTNFRDDHISIPIR